jgi:hypothetical protein
MEIGCESLDIIQQASDKIDWLGHANIPSGSIRSREYFEQLS